MQQPRQPRWGARLPLCVAKKLLQRLGRGWSTGDSCVPGSPAASHHGQKQWSNPKASAQPVPSASARQRGRAAPRRQSPALLRSAKSRPVPCCVRASSRGSAGGRYLGQGQLRHGGFGTSLWVPTGGMHPPPPPPWNARRLASTPVWEWGEVGARARGGIANCCWGWKVLHGQGRANAAG